MRGDGLALLVSGAVLVLLGLSFFSSLLDERMQARANALACSLQLANDELQHAVLHDRLTGLPNRQLLDLHLAKVAQQCQHHQQQAALLFIDLDGFKPINDLFGHAFGDAILVEVTTRLCKVAGTRATVARLGGMNLPCCCLT